MIGPQREAPKSVAAIQAEIKQLGNTMPSNEDYAAMAYGRGNRDPHTVKTVEREILREQRANTTLRCSGRTQKTIDAVVKAALSGARYIVVVRGDNTHSAINGRILEGLQNARACGTLNKFYNFAVRFSCIEIVDDEEVKCRIDFCRTEDLEKWTRGVPGVQVFFDHYAVEQLLAHMFGGATVAVDGGAWIRYA